MERPAATRMIPELEHTVTNARLRHDEVCAPALAQLGADIRTAQRELEHLDAQATVRRLEQLRRPSPKPPVGHDLGISL
jgi:hypothetical protein